MSQPDFWNDQASARVVSERAQNLRAELSQWEEIQREVDDALALAQEGEREQDASVADDLRRQLAGLRERLTGLEFTVLLSGPYDRRGAIVAIHAGAGGTEAQDWVEMLLRMYLRYAERRGLTTRIIDESRGQQAGIKSVVFEVSGPYAYGYLRSEAGVHRLVRISPFDAEAMRHTSFALLEVLPEFADDADVAIKDEDLKIDVFRSGGHGGQSVNTTDSAVRITHLPTGIVVKCQNERSQAQNKATAMKHLAAKLLARAAEEAIAAKRKIRGELHSPEWGSQVRSYVLQPYQLVKDHRTEYEERTPTTVLDGKLEGFVEAYLRWSKGEEGMAAQSTPTQARSKSKQKDVKTQSSKVKTKS